MAACENGDTEIVKLLIDAGVNVRRRGEVCSHNHSIKFDFLIDVF